MKKVSLEDISKELGVSKTLVSFVMNGRAKEKRISEEMTEKVLAKAKEMGYKANYLARALRTGKSNTLGLIMADISNAFFAKLARSIENEANEFGYNVIFGSSDEDSIKSGKLIEVFKNKKVDGLIICPAMGDIKYIKRLQKEKYPYVLVDRYFADVKSNVVVVNNQIGSYEIVNDQVKQGKKKIAMVNFNVGLINMDDRFIGYKEALKANGLELDHSLVKNVSFRGMENETELAVKELLEQKDRIDTIYFSNNQLAFLGLKYIIKNNKSVLDKINICSFDSFAVMDLMEIPMVYGTQPIQELGKHAVDLIMKQIDSDTIQPQEVVLPISYSKKMI